MPSIKQRRIHALHIRDEPKRQGRAAVRSRKDASSNELGRIHDQFMLTRPRSPYSPGCASGKSRKSLHLHREPRFSTQDWGLRKSGIYLEHAFLGAFSWNRLSGSPHPLPSPPSWQAGPLPNSPCSVHQQCVIDIVACLKPGLHAQC